MSIGLIPFFLFSNQILPVLPQLEFGALDIASPDIDGAARRIDDRLVCGVVETAVTPAKLYGKSAWGLHINVYRLTINVSPRSHTNGRLVDAQEVIRAHHIIERVTSSITCCSLGVLPGMHGAKAIV